MTSYSSNDLEGLYETCLAALARLGSRMNGQPRTDRTADRINGE